MAFCQYFRLHSRSISHFVLEINAKTKESGFLVYLSLFHGRFNADISIDLHMILVVSLLLCLLLSEYLYAAVHIKCSSFSCPIQREYTGDIQSRYSTQNSDFSLHLFHLCCSACGIVYSACNFFAYLFFDWRSTVSY